jgi:hypothetical protein
MVSTALARQLEAHLRAFHKSVQARALNSTDMHEGVTLSVLACDKSIAFLAIEPLNGSV